MRLNPRRTSFSELGNPTGAFPQWPMPMATKNENNDLKSNMVPLKSKMVPSCRRSMKAQTVPLRRRQNPGILTSASHPRSLCSADLSRNRWTNNSQFEGAASGLKLRGWAVRNVSFGRRPSRLLEWRLLPALHIDDVSKDDDSSVDDVEEERFMLAKTISKLCASRERSNGSRFKSSVISSFSLMTDMLLNLFS